MVAEAFMAAAVSMAEAEDFTVVVAAFTGAVADRTVVADMVAAIGN